MKLRIFFLFITLLSMLAAACGTDRAQEEKETVSPTRTPSPSTPPTPALDADALQVGDAAPDFTLPEADGETVALADYEDPVLLFFHMAEG